jgi:hypothetical protein
MWIKANLDEVFQTRVTLSRLHPGFSCFYTQSLLRTPCYHTQLYIAEAMSHHSRASQQAPKGFMTLSKMG